ncbi:hypothetical protein QJQ45_004232 [Haematococcus lacustris]|nr:hypothetical protein QJQ45_004232 [Haematococcus lacustris]
MVRYQRIRYIPTVEDYHNSMVHQIPLNQNGPTLPPGVQPLPAPPPPEDHIGAMPGSVVINADGVVLQMGPPVPRSARIPGGAPGEAPPAGDPPVATEPAPGQDLAPEEGAGLAPEFLPGGAVNAPATNPGVSPATNPGDAPVHIPGVSPATNPGPSLSPDPGAPGPSRLRTRRQTPSPDPDPSEYDEEEEDDPEPTRVDQLEQRNRELVAALAQRNAALSSVQQRLDSLEGNVAAAQNTVAALRREVGGPSRPGPSAPAPTDHGGQSSAPTTNCLWCGLDGHWVPDCPKKAAGLLSRKLSRKLSPAEINYTTGEQEFLSLVTACKEWRCYLEGVPFTLFTDHQPLVALPTQKVLSRRRARWMEFMSRFSYSLVHIAGTVNPADPLSRIVHDSPEKCLGSETPVTQDETAQYPAAPAAPMGLSDQLTLGYQQDPAFTANADHSGMYQDTDGLWRISGKDLVVVPNVPELREHILHEMHDAAYAGHVGMTKTLERVTRVFWWNTVRADVRDYVGTCDACQRDKSSNSKPGGLLRPLTVPGYRWEHVSMDLVTKLPTGTHGYDAICVIVDRLSKMVHFVPCKESMNAMAFARLFINNVFKLHGLPAEVLTDRGAHFNNKFWHAVKKLLGMKTNMSTAYRPQSDGQTERYNRVLEEMLRHYISPTQADWPDHLALAEFAVNNSWQESIHSTPFFLNTGQSPVTPGLRDLPDGGRCPSAHAFATWWKEGVAHARRHMADAQARYKRHADTGLRDVEFEVGAQVLLSTRNLRIKTGKVRKFVPRYVGPFVVEAKINANAYRLTLPANMSRLHPVFHVSLLKKYSGSDVGIMPPPVEWMDETPVFYVERLLDHRYVRAGKAGEFLVQWEGYDASFNTWEPRANLTGCDKLLAEYNAIHCLK